MSKSNSDSIIQQITGQPHWELSYRPDTFVKDRIPLSECVNLVEKNEVHLRGWPFPYARENHAARSTKESSIGSWIEFRSHIEYWRMFQSGQFYYASTIRETVDSEWDREIKSAMSNHLEVRGVDIKTIPGFISIINTIYSISEYIEFLSRITQKMKIADNITIKVGLSRVQGFALGADKDRAWMSLCQTDEVNLERSITHSAINLISNTQEISLKMVIWFFERFGWLEPNIDAIKEDQRKFLAKIM